MIIGKTSPSAIRPDGPSATGTDAPPSPAGSKARNTARKRTLWGLKLGVSAALIFWIVYTADLAAVAAAFAAINVVWLIPAVVSLFVGAALIAFRWQGLLSCQGFRPGWGFLFASVLVSTFFRQFLPSTFGGDAIRAYDTWKAGARSALALMSLLIDRLMGLLALALFVLIALTLSADLGAKIPGIWPLIWLGAGALSATLALIFRPARRSKRFSERLRVGAPGRIGAKLGQILDALGLYRGKHAVILRSFALSVILQINVVSFYWFIAQSLGIDLPYHVFYVVVPLAIFVMLLPVTVNGVGLREGIFIFLLGLWSVEMEQALALAWLEYGLFLGFGLLGGVVYGFRRQREKR